MYRLLSRTACVARNHSVCVHELCQAKCKKASRTFNGAGVNALSTSSFRLCEKNDPPGRGETTKPERESSQAKKGEQQVEPAVLKGDDGQTIPQGAGVEVKQVWSEPGQDKAAKSGTKNLWDLLSAMKVEVTNKRKLKNLKQSVEFAGQNQSKPKAMSMFQNSTEEASQSETLDPDLVAAASAAASTLPNSHQAESELLQQLKQLQLKQVQQHKVHPEAQENGNASNIGEIIANMKVGKRTVRQKVWSDQIQFDEDGRGFARSEGITGVLADDWKKRDVFPLKRLNIFSTSTSKHKAEPAVAKPTLWDVEFANRLSLVNNQLPRNHFEELIQWTEEGKLWQYPINNEIGLEEEARVPFHEHIFLEKHLEEGFPQQGPVRHFMELVLIGLSRNPYMTVQKKKEHIAWFRDYFHKKEEVLNDADVYLS